MLLMAAVFPPLLSMVIFSGAPCRLMARSRKLRAAAQSLLARYCGTPPLCAGCASSRNRRSRGQDIISAGDPSRSSTVRTSQTDGKDRVWNHQAREEAAPRPQRPRKHLLAAALGRFSKHSGAPISPLPAQSTLHGQRNRTARLKSDRLLARAGSGRCADQWRIEFSPATHATGQAAVAVGQLDASNQGATGRVHYLVDHAQGG